MICGVIPNCFQYENEKVKEKNKYETTAGFEIVNGRKKERNVLTLDYEILNEKTKWKKHKGSKGAHNLSL